MKQFLSIFLVIFSFFYLNAQNHWQAPEKAHELHNPLSETLEILKEGQKIYKSLCASCHGDRGTGNPVMLKTLNPPPADLTS